MSLADTGGCCLGSQQHYVTAYKTNTCVGSSPRMQTRNVGLKYVAFAQYFVPGSPVSRTLRDTILITQSYLTDCKIAFSVNISWMSRVSVFSPLVGNQITDWLFTELYTTREAGVAWGAIRTQNRFQSACCGPQVSSQSPGTFWEFTGRQNSSKQIVDFSGQWTCT